MFSGDFDEGFRRFFVAVVAADLAGSCDKLGDEFFRHFIVDGNNPRVAYKVDFNAIPVPAVNDCGFNNFALAYKGNEGGSIGAV